jgi:uncharacterized protein (TIGR02145 family)
MKKVFMLLASFSLLTFGTVSCNKDNDTTDNQNNQNTPSNPTDPTDPTDPTTGIWVDLGLPSGLLWATCNLGATTPEGYGDYYAWGELQTKEVYNWSTYRYCTVDADGGLSTLTKYNTSENYGTVDNKAVLEASDDVATAVLGSGARIPTKDEWQELLDNITAEWTTQNGVAGRKFTAANGNSIFLPAAGFLSDSELYYAGSFGGYWSSSLYTDGPYSAWDVSFVSGSQGVGSIYRCFGQSVRAVRASQN